MGPLYLFSLPARAKRPVQGVLLALLAAGASLVIGQASPPLVDLATEPLYMNGAKAKANLTLALSVEFPTVGQTYRGGWDPSVEYVGYFDPRACYRAILSNGSNGNYFDWKSNKTNISDTCPSSQFDGNFMNWATSSAIDIMRYGLTGGNRVLDDANTTIVERAWLPDSFYNNSAYFGVKFVPANQVAGRTENPASDFPNGMWIYNCKNRVYFAKEADGTGNCAAPFGVANAQSSKLVKANSNNNGNFYEVRNLVCDSNTATRRLMTYDPATKEWKGLCYQYPNGKYKPVGQFQVNSESLRVSVFGYLNDDNNGRYGGVLRAPMKYLGPKQFDANFNLLSTANPRAEWDVDTGVFIENPQSGDATYGAQGYPRSGAIMYINKFGTLNPDQIGKYKTHDPVSELYYEAVRYLQGKQPTSNAVSGLAGSVAADKTLTENYPVYSTWTNPFTGFQDSSGDAKSCLRNSILTIADVFTHRDHSVPGSSETQSGDFARAAETDPTLSVPFWTNVVGAFESKTAMTYTDSMGRTQTTTWLSGNADYDSLSGAGSLMTGAGSGSFHMAGLAYWANTQTFNSTYPKARIKTFAIDVNENRSSDNADFRRTKQLYLAAKYGGFEDSSAGSTGNPYQPGSNVLWQGTDGDAKNYFLVSDAKKFLDSLSEIFARVVEETGSIAGGAISTTRLTSSESASVYQARFNPVANFWSGRVLKYPISLSNDGQSIVIGSTPTWEAGQILTTRTTANNGSDRNIVIGPPKGRQGLDAPKPFTWADLPTAHQTVLNTSPTGTTDTLGSQRLDWLRGDRREEQNATNADGLFRPRDIVLGDVVNSGLVYVGKPTLSTPGADFRTFYDTYKTRRSVLYVNANDGMLHAFYDDNGQEAFAYIPGFLAPKLSKLPALNYLHASYADATPAVADAYINGAWKTTLVSGVGGGGQGVYALDVTDPSAFSASKVLWEFTDRDHPAMGNVLGAPQILKFRTNASSSTTPAYKYYAVVASGVNNYQADGYAHSGGNPSIFLLDLSFTPSSVNSWTEGTNFWRIELPQGSTAMAKGLVSFSSLKSPYTGAVEALYAGDLQGNLWKLDFTSLGTTSLGTNATTNFTTFNTVASDAAMFIAKIGTALQPITGEPTILNSYTGKKVVSFGTGKFLETADTSVPIGTTATFYAVMDPGNASVAARSSLQPATSNTTTGTVDVAPFIWGTDIANGQKSGWYMDFDAALAERQISDITALGGQLLFGSIYPTKGSCGEGGGRLYILNALSGDGISEESQVGVLAAPLVVTLGGTSLTLSDTTGQRTATERLGVITQGAKGLKTSTITSSYSYQVGRIAWRQINNYQANKAAP
jgi:type IV pilus assembly protein PilY1